MTIMYLYTININMATRLNMPNILKSAFKRIYSGLKIIDVSLRSSFPPNTPSVSRISFKIIFSFKCSSAFSVSFTYKRATVSFLWSRGMMQEDVFGPGYFCLRDTIMSFYLHIICKEYNRNIRDGPFDFLGPGLFWVRPSCFSSARKTGYFFSRG